MVKAEGEVDRCGGYVKVARLTSISPALLQMHSCNYAPGLHDPVPCLGPQVEDVHRLSCMEKSWCNVDIFCDADLCLWMLTCLVCSWTDRKWSLKELLRNPLPTPSCIGTWKSNVIDPARHQHTHPTEVKEWPAWEAEVKAIVEGLPSVRNL